MIFYHKDAPVEDIALYKKLLLEMRNDYNVKKFGQNKVIHRILETWQENDDIKRGLLKWARAYQIEFSHNSDDYELIFDLGKGRNPDNYYYILFPKDPNSFKVISNLHDRGLQIDFEMKRWIHDEFLKLITHFPKAFELYYGDLYTGDEDDVTREVWFQPRPTYVRKEE